MFRCRFGGTPEEKKKKKEAEKKAKAKKAAAAKAKKAKLAAAKAKKSGKAAAKESLLPAAKVFSLAKLLSTPARSVANVTVHNGYLQMQVRPALPDQSTAVSAARRVCTYGRVHSGCLDHSRPASSRSSGSGGWRWSRSTRPARCSTRWPCR